ncbi:hypothetical protein QUW35_02855 [Ligilactobacillus agilis]|uniref:hypothetical protein n=1 Tax=Ligilactobacillus agilis TaxID=1601 RepID=UPI0025A4A351|nr:hypothetical protein [Ligilactobacillus agilis]MDM8279632.1 hypothetical protein [Ligilactobacillus agilis]
MKLYKRKKGDILKTVGVLIFAIVFVAIASYFNWPSPDEIFHYLLPYIIVGIIVGIPLFYLILCILSELF